MPLYLMGITSHFTTKKEERANVVTCPPRIPAVRAGGDDAAKTEQLI